MTHELFEYISGMKLKIVALNDGMMLVGEVTRNEFSIEVKDSLRLFEVEIEGRRDYALMNDYTINTGEITIPNRSILWEKDAPFLIKQGFLNTKTQEKLKLLEQKHQIKQAEPLSKRMWEN